MSYSKRCMKVILGTVNNDFSVHLLRVEKTDGNTHDYYGIDGDHTFRVVESPEGSTIYWWFRKPKEDLLNEVHAKLNKFGAPGPYKHVRLSHPLECYPQRFYDCHGYY